MYKGSTSSSQQWQVERLSCLRGQRQPLLDSSVSTFLLLSSAVSHGNTQMLGSSVKPWVGNAYVQQRPNTT